MSDLWDWSGTITIQRRELMQVAQQVHQGYHDHIGGTWRECPMGSCERIRSILHDPSGTSAADRLAAQLVAEDGA